MSIQPQNKFNNSTAFFVESSKSKVQFINANNFGYADVYKLSFKEYYKPQEKVTARFGILDVPKLYFVPIDGLQDILEKEKIYDLKSQSFDLPKINLLPVVLEGDAKVDIKTTQKIWEERGLGNLNISAVISNLGLTQIGSTHIKIIESLKQQLPDLDNSVEPWKKHLSGYERWRNKNNYFELIDALSDEQKTQIPLHTKTQIIDCKDLLNKTYIELSAEYDSTFYIKYGELQGGESVLRVNSEQSWQKCQQILSAEGEGGVIIQEGVAIKERDPNYPSSIIVNICFGEDIDSSGILQLTSQIFDDEDKTSFGGAVWIKKQEDAILELMGEQKIKNFVKLFIDEGYQNATGGFNFMFNQDNQYVGIYDFNPRQNGNHPMYYLRKYLENKGLKIDSICQIREQIKIPDVQLSEIINLFENTFGKKIMLFPTLDPVMYDLVLLNFDEWDSIEVIIGKVNSLLEKNNLKKLDLYF
jgi:hypothetical protein